ncbi:ead/Ea22-like family protein [Pseudomonas aeruginosa]|nr:ead/Ea22-like family protein [Pseudomonas aeruginosa]
MDTNKLKELAERATPGPWVVDAQQSGAIFNIESESGDLCIAMSQENPASTRLEMNEQRRVNAEFIAAANPQAILKLIAEVDLLSARLKAENCAHKDTQKHCELLEQYLKECASALPGTYYMDPPDGGDVSIPEQIRRMAKDAARYRWLRERDLETIRQGGVFAGMTPENIVLNQEDLDGIIDAALKGATQ